MERIRDKVMESKNVMVGCCRYGTRRPEKKAETYPSQPVPTSRPRVLEAKIYEETTVKMAEEEKIVTTIATKNEAFLGPRKAFLHRGMAAWTISS
jgi:hypothetical protein